MGELSIIDRKILAACILNVDITEVYSHTRVNAVAAKFGLIAGNSLDLKNGWMFDLQEHRNKAWALIAKTKPYLLIGFPPCTMFSNLQGLNKHIHKDDEGWLARFEKEKKRAEKTSRNLYAAIPASAS